MKIGKLVLFSLAVMSVISESCYGRNRLATDWDQYFKAGIAPSYPYEARLEMTRSTDEHYSYADSNGQTQSWHCSADESGAECADGSGLSYYLVQADGARYFVDIKIWENDPWRMTFDTDFFLAGQAGGNPFHFRLVTQDGVNLACIQQPGTESIPNGKPRREYAKHHRLESCYWVSVSGTDIPLPTLPREVKDTVIANSESGKHSAAAAASLANNGHILTPEESAAEILAGIASRCAVVTNPPGAEIEVDGNKAGISPMVFLLQKAATPRTLAVSLPGYRTVTRSVVPDGETIPLGLTLEKIQQ